MVFGGGVEAERAVRRAVAEGDLPDDPSPEQMETFLARWIEEREQEQERLVDRHLVRLEDAAEAALDRYERRT